MATFIMREMDADMNKSRRQRYPHLLKTGEVTLREMAEDIAQGNTFTRGDVIGVVQAVAGRIARYAAQGLTVRVEGLGTLRAPFATQLISNARHTLHTIVAGTPEI